MRTRWSSTISNARAAISQGNVQTAESSSFGKLPWACAKSVPQSNMSAADTANKEHAAESGRFLLDVRVRRCDVVFAAIGTSCSSEGAAQGTRRFVVAAVVAHPLGAAGRSRSTAPPLALLQTQISSMAIPGPMVASAFRSDQPRRLVKATSSSTSTLRSVRGNR